jgi:hypothetical protein
VAGTYSPNAQSGWIEFSPNTPFLGRCIALTLHPPINLLLQLGALVGLKLRDFLSHPFPVRCS